MQILDKFTDTKVLIVGDVMLDRYWWGNVKRISPEAPVPVVELQKSTFAPGGAANVAANIAGLGARAYLFGSIGMDHEADALCELLSGLNVHTEHLARLDTRSTSVKTRVIAHNQQVVRVDLENTAEYSESEQWQFWERVSAVLPEVDILIVSDYAKGLLSDSLLTRLFEAAKSRGIMVLVDPKGKSYDRYRGATLLTPNRREAAEACNLNEDSPEVVNIAGNRLLDDLGLEAILITRSEEGMTLFRRDMDTVHLAAAARDIYDVTGAGDTVIACMGVAMGAGTDLETAARIANMAAGLVVEQVGTTAITAAMLKDEINKLGLHSAQHEEA